MDKFGYRSLHYVLTLKGNRSKLTEYKKFKNIKVEIQIRTILQHSWAEIEHDIGYKGETEIPDFAKRTFYRIAALLETADIEFVKLKEILRNYENQLSAKIISSPESVKIDRDSLISFIESNELVKKIDKEIANKCNVPLQDDYETYIGELIESLKKQKIDTIQKLKNKLELEKNNIFNKYFEKLDYDYDDLIGLAKGITLFQLRHFN